MEDGFLDPESNYTAFVEVVVPEGSSGQNVIGMVSNKMSKVFLTIFGHKYFKQNFIKKFDIFHIFTFNIGIVRDCPEKCGTDLKIFN